MKKLIGLVAMGIILVGCGANYKEVDFKNMNESDLTSKIEEEFMDRGIDLSLDDIVFSEEEEDEKLSQLIKESIDYKPEYGQVKYLYNQVDLNGDGKKEVLVYLMGGYVSGSGGTTLLLLDSDGQLKQNFTLINKPIIISHEKTKGYSNIIVPVYGGGENFHFAELRYDGNSYPSNPSMVSEVMETSGIKGSAILVNSPKDKDEGILLR